MSFCSQCGTKQNEGAKFCFSCGAPQQSTEPGRTASKSSSLNELTSGIIENYLEVKSDDNFDPESITEEIFQGVVYSELTRREAAVPTEAGVEVMKLALASLTELSESLDED